MSRLGNVVTFQKPEAGLGLTVGDPPEGETLPVIAKLVDGGCASQHMDQTMVAVGNRILSVNGQDMEGKGRDEIHAIVRATPPGGEIVFLIKHINECDPDPGVVSLTCMVKKAGPILGMMAADSKKVQDYPSIAKIGKGTPAFEHPDMEVGDKIKHINGVFVQGHTKAYVHETIRSISDDGNVVLGIIKKGTKRVQVQTFDATEDSFVEKDSFAAGRSEVKFASFSGGAAPKKKEFKEKSDGFAHKAEQGSVYGGFGDDDDDEFAEKPNAFAHKKAQGSTYGGFGSEDVFAEDDDEFDEDEEFDEFGEDDDFA